MNARHLFMTVMLMPSVLTWRVATPVHATNPTLGMEGLVSRWLVSCAV